jgi:hypothetical protein
VNYGSGYWEQLYGESYYWVQLCRSNHGRSQAVLAEHPMVKTLQILRLNVGPIGGKYWEPIPSAALTKKIHREVIQH